MANTVRDVLDGAFEFARQRGVFKGKTNQAEAKFLGMDPAVLSRLKGGKTPLTENRIAQIAQRLSGGDESYRETLQAELRNHLNEAASAASKNQLVRSVEEFFANISSETSLLCVDYRDLPQSTDQGEYPLLANVAANAISRGLHFAMFQPFGGLKDIEKSLSEEKWFRPARSYLLSLAEFVRTAYIKIKDLAGPAAAGEIVLYESKSVPPIPACGINSRLFYVDCLNEVGRHETEVYQWIDGRGADDYFVQRGQSALSKDAVSQQFFPIPDYWLSNRKLPRSESDLRTAVSAARARFETIEATTRKHERDKAEVIPWSVFT
jgi:hypothetical protein